jgi:hypothetical protein
LPEYAWPTLSILKSDESFFGRNSNAVFEILSAKLLDEGAGDRELGEAPTEIVQASLHIRSPPQSWFNVL